jgi:hypothetical protein
MVRFAREGTDSREHDGGVGGLVAQQELGDEGLNCGLLRRRELAVVVAAQLQWIAFIVYSG